MDRKKLLRHRVGILSAFSLVPLVMQFAVTGLFFIPGAESLMGTFWGETFFMNVAYELLYAAIIFFCAYAALKPSRAETNENAKLTLRDYVPVSFEKPGAQILAVLGAVAFSFVWSMAVNTFLTALEEAGFYIADWNEGMILPETNGEWLGYILLLSVGPAIFEELVFRGAVLGSLKKLNTTAAIVVSALLFGFFHCTVTQIPFAFGLGLVLGWLCVRFDSILVPMAVHLINNLIAGSEEYLINRLGEEAGSVIAGLFVMLLIVVGIIATVFFFVNNSFRRRCDADAEGKNAMTASDGAAGVASSAMFWVTLAIYTVFTLIVNFAS